MWYWRATTSTLAEVAEICGAAYHHQPCVLLVVGDKCATKRVVEQTARQVLNARQVDVLLTHEGAN